MEENKNPLITWKDGDKTKSIGVREFYENINKLPVYTSKSANTFQNSYTNIDIRDEYSYFDFENYRPGQRIPKTPKGKIAACMQAYEESGNGIVKNTVDLMGDFTVKGINVVHQNKKIEMWWQTWFHNVVNGPERSERIANLLPRAGMAVIQKNTAKLELRKSKEFFKGQYSPNTEYKEQEYDIVRREIPVSYNILNPLSLDVENEKFISLITTKDYEFSLKLPDELVRIINYPQNESDSQLISKLPADMINRIRSGKKTVLLDKTKTKSIFYKKDDWKVYPTPMLYTILRDLQSLQKMKLADDSALDGVISQLRVWKIGNLEHKVYPDLASMQKLASILMNAGGGGITDLIWGPDLELQEITTNYHSILGESKYIPILNAIWTGLGIPALFTGSSSQGSSTTNYIAIQTLIERLESFRALLVEFWENEFKEVMIAMKGVPGFEIPPVLIFDKMILSDPSSIYQILTGMVDRNILSEEFVQNIIGAIPSIEESRLKREDKQRRKNVRPPKAGPYHRPQIKEDWLGTFINQGVLTPSEVGLELEERDPKQLTPEELKNKSAVKLAKAKPPTPTENGPISQGGRPKNKKDKVKRKTKKTTIRTKANFASKVFKVENYQNILSEKLTDMYLLSLSKQNLRQLTVDEFNSFEKYKFAALCSVDFNKELTENDILEVVDKKPELPVLHFNLYNSLINEYKKREVKEPTTNILRKLQCVTCASINEIKNDADYSNNDL